MIVGEEKEITIEEFFKMCEEDSGTYQIDTPDGWQEVGFLISRKGRECNNLVFDDGSELGCSSDHLIFTDSGWKRSEDIDVNIDKALSETGEKEIYAKEYLGIRDTFDIEVKSEEHRYYSNGIISHNCGKSLIAKAVASLYNIPLLRLDFGSLFAAHVGESEEKARNALKIADALEPAILWVDEVEKGISGTASSGSTDGGTTDRVVGTFLTWMQEHKTTVIVLATGNDHEKIPAAFMRAGRFDEIFFVDFPNTTERKQIFEVLVKKYGRNPKNFDISALANKSLNYTGAEIEKSITSALFEGYSDSRRDITTDDIMASLSSFQPQYVMRPDYFDDMRVWAKGKGFIEASDPDEGYKDSSRIGIDVG